MTNGLHVPKWRRPLPVARVVGTHDKSHWRRGFALGYFAGYMIGIVATTLALR